MPVFRCEVVGAAGAVVFEDASPDIAPAALWTRLEAIAVRFASQSSLRMRAYGPRGGLVALTSVGAALASIDRCVHGHCPLKAARAVAVPSPGEQRPCLEALPAPAAA